ncbi:unnamed protein product [Moneuplotes crassus]|uniref:Rab-GAP TBC domain-containing protein n=1 Tax=Euplotes crassus TaxID=5936 RepID=A0AAD1XHF8_EUPCR|nr:unnamed protein product [Moneuplotes crassus]
MEKLNTIPTVPLNKVVDPNQHSSLSRNPLILKEKHNSDYSATITDEEVDQEENEELRRKQVDFPLNMWGSLEAIKENSKKGANICDALINFTKTFHRAYDTYRSTLEKSLKIFENEMLKFCTLDTTMICMSSFSAEMKNMLSDMRGKLDEFDDLLYIPSLVFTRKYQAENKQHYDHSKKYLQEIDAARREVKKTRERYFKNFETQAKSEEELERKQKQQEETKRDDRNLDLEHKTELSFQEYKQEVEFFNILIQEADNEYYPALSALQAQEEKRINFVKHTMEKFLDYYSQCHTVLLLKEEKFNDSVKMINHHTDLQIFVDENRTKSQKKALLGKLEVELYQPKRVSNASNENGCQPSTDTSSFDANPFEENSISQEEIDKNVLFVQQKIKDMIKNKSELKQEDKEDILNFVHLHEVNLRISEDLMSITDVKESHVLKDLSDIVNIMITESTSDKHNGFKIINNVLQCSSTIYCKKRQADTPRVRKDYLADLILPHSIWKEPSLWKYWIYNCIVEKKLDKIDKKKIIIEEKYKNLKEQAEKDDPNASMMSKWLSRMTKPLTSFELDQEERKEIEQLEETGCDHRTVMNIMFNVLSVYLRHLSQFKVPLDISKQIILHFCEKYELDKDRTQLILSELESTYSTGGFTDQEQMRVIIQRRQTLMETLENDSGLVVLYLISEYFNSDKDLMNILSLNKSTQKFLKPIIYRRCLLNARKNVSQEKRSFLWNYFLKIGEVKLDYIALRDKINQNPQMIEKAEEIIILDVQRSFNNTAAVSQENLSNILKTYAFYNPEIEYCQGMNFLAGFFYFYYKDEQDAFKALLALIKKFDLTELFNATLPRLKLYFYVLDRLISLYLPDLHEHFKNEHITSSLFSSAWFITCFCTAVTNQKTPELHENLVFFWDNFVIDGYVVIFQTAVVLLGLFEEKILELSFEEILNYIADIPKAMFSNTGKSDEILQEVEGEENIVDQNLIDIEYVSDLPLVSQNSEINPEVEEIVNSSDFPKLLSNSPISKELIAKIELEYKENESQRMYY